MVETSKAGMDFCLQYLTKNEKTYATKQGSQISCLVQLGTDHHDVASIKRYRVGWGLFQKQQNWSVLNN